MNPKRNLSRAMAALAAAATALTGMFAVGSTASAAQAAQGCVASKYADWNFININAPDVNQLLTSEKDPYGDARARTFRFVKIADYVFDANGTLTGFKSGHYDEGVVIGSSGKDSVGANRGMYSWDLAAWPLKLHNGNGDFAEGYVYDQSGEDPMQWMSEHLLSDSAKVRKFVDAIDETNWGTKDENGKEIGRVSDYVTSGGIVHDPAKQPYAAISRYNDGTGQLQYPLKDPGMYLAYDTSGEQKIDGTTYTASKPLLIGTKLAQSPENCLPAIYGSTQIANTGTPEEKPKGSFIFYVKDDKGAVLEGAKFAISRTVDGVRKYGRIDNGKWVFDRDSVDDLGENDIRVSTDAGTVLFPFVESGDYTVEETSAPAGYGDALVTFDVTVNAFTAGAGTSLTYEATPGTGLTGEDNMHQDGRIDAKLTVVNAKAKSDKTALDTAVKKAEGLKESEYTPDSWKALQTELAKAKQVQADKDADQKAVDAAVKVLDAAIDALEKPRMPVRFYVKDENGKGLAGAGFVVSKDGKYGRYADGKWVFDKANATDEGVTVESSKIDTSDDLGDAFAEFPDLETGDYTIEQVTAPKGYENPKVRFTVAFRAFPQDGGISMEYETTVDKGYEQYVTGKDYDNDGLIDHALSVRNDKAATPSVDKTKLDAAVKKAEGLKESEYTADSWKVFKDALAKAQSVQKDDKADQKAVDAATKALNDAIGALKKPTPSYPSGPSTPSQPVGLQVVYKPNKLEYRIGEEFDPTGMVVKYQGSTLGSDQYTVALDTSKPGKVKAFVTLNSDPSKATSFEVTVVVSDVQAHRLYNPRSGEHFYTANENEYNALTKSGQWRDEGVGFTMVDYGTPVYRLYNPGGKHLFTTSERERDVLIKAKWNYEGVAFYVPESSDGSDDSAAKVHRLYNPGNGDHLLTTSANERGVLVMHGWRDEGTAFTAR